MKNLISKIYGKLFLKHFNYFRKRKLKYTDFTIISNNCWGGIVYQYLGLPYNSPTIGLYFFADDYIKFLKNIKEYVKADLDFISLEESRYIEELKKRNHTHVIIGKLKDIEIIFLHYKTKEEAYKKWNRRIKRINWKKLIVKFNDQNLCNENNILSFELLPYKNKIFFSANKNCNINSCIYMKMFDGQKYVKDDTSLYNFTRYLNIINYINNMYVDIPKEDKL